MKSPETNQPKHTSAHARNLSRLPEFQDPAVFQLALMLGESLSSYELSVDSSPHSSTENNSGIVHGLLKFFRK